MGYCEDWMPSNCKIEEPAEDQNPAHAYPDWPMMQGYYGPHFTVPLYLNSAVAFPPPYMLVVPVPSQPQPQYMLLPYPIYYAHEAGVYGHPGLGVSMGFSTAESTGNTEGGNGNADSGEHAESDQVTEDSSDGINGVKAEEVDTGELATIVETLIDENIRLKSEIDKFMEISKNLELENAILMETIKDARPGEVNSHKIDDANLFARVDSNGSTERRDGDGDESYGQRKASSAARSDDQMW